MWLIKPHYIKLYRKREPAIFGQLILSTLVNSVLAHEMFIVFLT